MGEGAECVPAVIMRRWPNLVFNDTAGQDDFFIPLEEDIFAPLLQAFRTHGRKRTAVF